jgi:O-methyltransferase
MRAARARGCCTVAEKALEPLQLLYLDLLKKSLLGYGEDAYVRYGDSSSDVWVRIPFEAEKRDNGRDHPSQIPVSAKTMIGLKRMENLQYCIETVLKEDVPGDVVETGVWRGGASIFMRGALEALGDQERRVWCADSFEGLPTPNIEKYPQDKDVDWHTHPWLAVGLDEVKRNFSMYNLLDRRVEFLVGWFKDTLGNAPIKAISILRLDGDMYESTKDALNGLYKKVSPGGFVIVDDYGLPQDTCRRAIHDFRFIHDIQAPIIDIDGWGAFWRVPR